MPLRKPYNEEKENYLFKLWGTLGVWESCGLVSEGPCIPDNVVQEPPGFCVNEAFQARHTTSLVPLKWRFLEVKLSAGEKWTLCHLSVKVFTKKKLMYSCPAWHVPVRSLVHTVTNGGSKWALFKWRRKKKFKSAQKSLRSATGEKFAAHRNQH